VRGGIWKNFFMRYPEANWMHKRMLALSGGWPPCRRKAGAAQALTDHLYRAQANDAYWHGLFGGLYLPHLRREVWRNLVALEAALDAVAPRPPLAVGDADHDGMRELVPRQCRAAGGGEARWARPPCASSTPMPWRTTSATC
jgi:hypothetical protein